MIGAWAWDPGRTVSVERAAVARGKVGGTKMLQLKRNKAAFTLIELLVVVIIVAILAAVGVPLLSANVRRARASEAESGIGAIRTGVRAYQSENNNSAHRLL